MVNLEPPPGLSPKEAANWKAADAVRRMRNNPLIIKTRTVKRVKEGSGDAGSPVVETITPTEKITVIKP